MNPDELEKWFEGNKTLLETAYLTGQQPWQQSGFGLHTPRTYADWEALRKPVAGAMDKSGTFLDIGCANGYLLECVLRWTGERGLTITPYGLDLSEKMVELARQRLPQYANHFFTGNVWDWQPPQTFDYVRTELVYLPAELRSQFVIRLLTRFLNPGGKLLLAEYRSRRDPPPNQSIDHYLTQLGFEVVETKSGFLQGQELTRIAILDDKN